jgi:hypothetical protein
MFWTCITAKGPGYGTTIIEGSINSSLYVEILQSSLKDTLDYYELDSKHVRFQRDKAVVNMTCSVSVTNQVNVRQCLYSACALTAL